MSRLYCHSCKKERIIKNISEKENRNEYSLVCGHTFVTLSVKEVVKGYDMIGIKRKNKKSKGKHKWNLETKVGERLGIDGKVAFLRQVIDRKNDIYEKFVKQGDVIIKNVREKLTDHRQ